MSTAAVARKPAQTSSGPLRAGIYVRISSDQELERLGVERQAEDCRERVKRNGWQLHRVYEDNDISAFSGKVRPAYRQLLEDVQAGEIQVIVTWAPDRLYRSLRDLSEFVEIIKGAGCQVEAVKAGNVDFSTANGQMIATILGATAIAESGLKSERQRRKHLQLAEAGEDAGGGRPFGYEIDRRTIRSSEAALIIEAADRVLAGGSLRGLCREFERRGIATVTGKGWSVQVIRRILVSARISGRRERRTIDGERREIGTIVSDAVWPGIISADKSDALRSFLGNGDRRLNGHSTKNLLTGGIAVCGVPKAGSGIWADINGEKIEICGASLVSRPKGHGRGNPSTPSIVCATGPGFHGCGGIRIQAEPLDELVSEAVLRRVDKGGLTAAMHTTDDRAAVKELEGVELKLEELARDWAADRITRRERDASRSVLIGRREELQRRVERTRRAHNLDGLPSPLRGAWATLELHRRRAVISALVESIVITPALRGLNRFDAKRVHPQWKA